jgi:hypothetical protein
MSALSHGLGWAELHQALGDGLVTAWVQFEDSKSPGRALRPSSQITGKELGLLTVKKIVFYVGMCFPWLGI